MNKEVKRIWIVVIQSLNDSVKLKTGCGIFKDLKNWCNNPEIGILPKYYEVISKKELEDKINEIIALIQENDSLLLHIESHGNYDRIWLVNDGVEWNDFWKISRPLSEKVNNRVVYVLSMCRSKYSSLIFCNNQTVPFQYLIASNDIVDSGPACLALKMFYKEYISSKNIKKAFKILQYDYISRNKDCPFLLLSPQDVISMHESILYDYENIREIGSGGAI